MRLSRLPPRGVEGWIAIVVSILISQSLQERTFVQVLILVMSTERAIFSQIVEQYFQSVLLPEDL